jgi:hypothetical protein
MVFSVHFTLSDRDYVYMMFADNPDDVLHNFEEQCKRMHEHFPCMPSTFDKILQVVRI